MNDPFQIPRAKWKETPSIENTAVKSAKIAADTKAFLKAGGKITKIKMGVSGPDKRGYGGMAPAKAKSAQAGAVLAAKLEGKRKRKKRVDKKGIKRPMRGGKYG